MTNRLTLRQRFTLHCALTDTANLGATWAARVAERSQMWSTAQCYAVLRTLETRGLVSRTARGHFTITDKGRALT